MVLKIGKSLILTMMMFSCGQRIHGTLEYYEAAPEKGFHFPYFLFIPDGKSLGKQQFLIVEPNNSGFVSDDLRRHVEKAKRTASKDFYVGNFVARKLNIPLLVPVFPRPESDWKIYTHALDRDVLLQEKNNLEKIDLQLLAMVNHARGQLENHQITVHDKFLITGFSASGTFANRFTLLHPDKIHAVAAGGLNGLLMLPVDSLDSVELKYPLGTADVYQLTGSTFDPELFQQIPQFYFMGAMDDNDAIPFEDAFEDDERQRIYQLFGHEMMPARWEKCKKIYHAIGINADIRTYQETGHQQTEEIKRDVARFFEMTIGEN